MKPVFRIKRHTAGEYVKGILSGERVMLGKAITLVESRLDADNEMAEAVLKKLLPHTGNSIRIGITGVPGAGKSTLIEAFGGYLTATGKKVAVLTIDPSSQKTKGSILADKTRMESLANDPNAFVRPSASGATLGGVHNRTRETLLLCEAAGFDVIIVETVGVGQSEVSVKGIVDFFLLIMISGAGDELQGIKRGIMEMADLVAINKADGDNVQRSKMARLQYENALHLFPPNENNWYPKVLTCSAINNTGIKEIWDKICLYEAKTKENNFFSINRQQQNLQWMHETIRERLQNSFYQHAEVKNHIDQLQQDVQSEKVPAIIAAKTLLNLFFSTKRNA